MGRWLLCFICCNVGLVLSTLFPKPSALTTDVFIFGFCEADNYVEGNRGGRVAFHKTGTISKAEKIVHIPIKLDFYCMDLTDVRVEVNNAVGPPFVTLDRDLLIVTIKYRPKQASLSTYLVVAKASC